MQACFQANSELMVRLHERSEAAALDYFAHELASQVRAMLAAVWVWALSCHRC